MKRIILAGLLALLSISGAHAQCSGIQPAGSLCGNPAGTGAPAAPSRVPVLGLAGTAIGTLGLSGNTSGLVTIKPQAAAGTYNFNLPTGAGTSGQPMLSGGGVAAAMTFGTLGVAGGGSGAVTLTGILQGNGTSAFTVITNSSTVGQVLRVTGAATYAWGAVDLADTDAVTGILPVANGGTNASSASGTALDNISGFSSTGIMSRTGAGTYTFSTESTLLDAIGSTRGSVLYRGASGWAALTPGTANFVLTSNGAGADPSYVAVGSGTVTSATVAGTSNVISVSGTCTITTTGTCTLDLATARKTLPTVQSFTSGSGTYTTPANVLWIEIKLCGGGGGGAGGGSAGSTGGGNGGNTTFSTLTGSGGSSGTGVYTNLGGAGGAASGGSSNLPGGSGSTGSPPFTSVGSTGGHGGASALGGGGGGGNVASAGGPPGICGGGGGGGSAGVATGGGGSGGGGGGTVYQIINTPAGTYSYAVGAVGTAGSAGTSGNAGIAGGSGYIIVIEHYGS